MTTQPIPSRHDQSRLARLDPVARMLLTTDGTVTPVLEQLVGERIVTAHLAQSTTTADAQTAESLRIEEGTSILARTTDLIGANSGRVLVKAVAMIRLEALPSTLRTDLLTTEHPIGKLLVSHRFESFRELLTWSIPPDPHARNDNPPAAGTSKAAGGTTAESRVVAERCYRVIHAHRAAFLITERFTAACFPRQTDENRPHQLGVRPC